MPRGKFNLKSAKVTRKNTKYNIKQTRKQARYLSEKDKRERILQGAIAGAVVQEELQNLQAEGVVPVGANLNLNQAERLLLRAAGRAAEPATLTAQIKRQVREVKAKLRATGVLVQTYTPRNLVRVFIGLAMAYWATFPAHAPPGDMTLFDVAASHLSTAGTVTGLLFLPQAATLTALATGAKLAGHTVRVSNAYSGLHPMANRNRRREVLNVMEYAPAPLGTVLTVGKLGGIVSGAAMNHARGASNYKGAVTNAFTASSADVATKMGKRLGYNEETTLKTLVPETF